MSSNVQVLGPIHHFIRFRGQTTANYLGTAEVSPLVNGQPFKLRVQNDVAGRSVGIQDVYDGERHEVTTVLGKFDYAIWKAVKDTVYHQSSIASHGTDDRLKRGSLLRGYGDFALILLYEFTGITPLHPQATTDQPVGRIYFYANLDGFTEDPSATRVMALPCTFGCESLLNPSDRSFKLYSEDPSQIGTLGPIT